MKFMARVVVVVAVLLGASAAAPPMPVEGGSVRFAVLGDVGTGDTYQIDVARQLMRRRDAFPFTFAILLGDNIYGAERPQDFDRKFVRPYKALIDAGVEFYAALGNHDDQNQRYYKPYTLDGKRYRTFKKGNVRFFVLDSNYMDPEQVTWLKQELEASGSDWKIAYFHHPLYTTAPRGPEVELRKVLEPIFVANHVDVVFNGHEHIYQRIKPQKGITYFVTGSAAKLRRGDARPGAIVDKAYDADRAFMLIEVAGNEMHYECITRKGTVIDRGVIIKGKT